MVRQTARNAGDYEDAVSDFLEKTYADRSGASSGLSTTYGILSFVGFLAVCRTIEILIHHLPSASGHPVIRPPDRGRKGMELAAPGLWRSTGSHRADPCR